MGSSSTPSTTQYLDRGDADGCVLGRASTVKIGVWGATPVSRGSVSSVVPPGVTAATTTSPWGFATSTQADAVALAVRNMEQVLRTLGFSQST